MTAPAAAPAADAVNKIVFADNLFHGARNPREAAFDCTNIGSNVLFNGKTASRRPFAWLALVEIDACCA